MDCQTAESMVNRYISHELAGEELEEFLTHISECSACRDELEIYFTVSRAMEQLTTEEDSTLDFRDLLDQDLKKAHRSVYRMKISRLAKIWSAFLMGMLAVAVALMMIFESR
ncbi:MAG: zf-HC2 domain-containing protein [Eubacteriales bacterium]|nr:zf-HC2 domain-containing protein [Eubacteriales bacterium]